MFLISPDMVYSVYLKSFTLLSCDSALFSVCIDSVVTRCWLRSRLRSYDRNHRNYRRDRNQVATRAERDVCVCVGTVTMVSKCDHHLHSDRESDIMQIIGLCKPMSLFSNSGGLGHAKNQGNPH